MYLLSCKWMFFRLVEPNKLYSCIKKNWILILILITKSDFYRTIQCCEKEAQCCCICGIDCQSHNIYYWTVCDDAIDLFFFLLPVFRRERERIVDSLRIVRIYSPSPVEDSFKICAWGCCSLLLAWHFGCDNVASSFCLSLSLSLFHDRTHFCKAINFMICFNARCVALFLSLPVYRGKPKQLVVNANNWVPIFNR